MGKASVKKLTPTMESALGAMAFWNEKTGNAYRGHMAQRTLDALVQRGLAAYEDEQRNTGRITAEGREVLQELIADAEARASMWLADGNEADEGGKLTQARECWQKSQRYLDQANRLRANDSPELARRAEQLVPNRDVHSGAPANPDPYQTRQIYCSVCKEALSSTTVTRGGERVVEVQPCRCAQNIKYPLKVVGTNAGEPCYQCIQEDPYFDVEACQTNALAKDGRDCDYVQWFATTINCAGCKQLPRTHENGTLFCACRIHTTVTPAEWIRGNLEAG